MIEVGEYVRLDDGTIGKYEVNKNWKNVVETNDRYIGFDIERDVVKHSKNIIDLLEVGDVVRTYDVLNYDVLYIWSEDVLKALKEDIENGIGIEAIITREQFAQAEYKIEEDK